MKTIQQMAQEYLQYFELRHEGDRGFYVIKDNSPEDVQTLVAEAHKGMPLDYWKRRFIYNTLQLLAEGKNEDYIQSNEHPDILREYFASHFQRARYCNDYVEYRGESDYDYDKPGSEIHPSSFDIMKIIQGGQDVEKMEVFRRIQSGLDVRRY